MADERDVRAAGAGVVENVCTGAAAAGAVENTCWPVADVTVPPVERGLVVAVERGLVLAAGVRAVVGRLGAEVVRSAEAGAGLRATLGDRNVGDGAV